MNVYRFETAHSAKPTLVSNPVIIRRVQREAVGFIHPEPHTQSLYVLADDISGAVSTVVCALDDCLYMTRAKLLVDESLRNRSH